MKIISHRGNISGQVPDKENRPSYIDCAIGLGYDVEVDVRFVDGNFWLGHDFPQYKIESKWMSLRKNKIWFHCKNVESSMKLIEKNDNFNFFCHVNDDFILTSNNKLWVHNLQVEITDKCIIPLLSPQEITKYSNGVPYGVCTDYVYQVESKFGLRNFIK